MVTRIDAAGRSSVFGRRVAAPILVLSALTACAGQSEATLPAADSTSAVSSASTEQPSLEATDSSEPSPTVEDAVFDLPLATDKKYEVTFSATDSWVPGVELGDPGFVRLSDTSGAGSVTAAVTNRTVGGRPVALDWSNTPYHLEKYWHLPASLAKAACETCSTKSTYILGVSFMGVDDTLRNVPLEGDATLEMLVPGSTAVVVDVAARTGGEKANQFPEDRQAEVEDILNSAADYVFVRLPRGWVQDGITQGGSCLTKYEGVWEYVDSVFDGETGRLLSESEARKTGIACAARDVISS